MMGCPCVGEGYVHDGVSCEEEGYVHHDGVSLCERRGMFMMGCPCVREGYVNDGVSLCGGGVSS